MKKKSYCLTYPRLDKRNDMTNYFSKAQPLNEDLRKQQTTNFACGWKFTLSLSLLLLQKFYSFENSGGGSQEHFLLRIDGVQELENYMFSFL